MHNMYKKLPNTSKYMLFIFIFLSTKSNVSLFVASKLQQLNSELDARDGNYMVSNRKNWVHMNKLYLMRLYLFNNELSVWDDSYTVSNRKTEYIWTWTLPNVFLSKGKSQSRCWRLITPGRCAVEDSCLCETIKIYWLHCWCFIRLHVFKSNTN
jgi:hypothetical protein